MKTTIEGEIMNSLRRSKYRLAWVMSIFIAASWCIQGIGAMPVLGGRSQQNTPEAGAKALFSAWQNGDKAIAARYATRKAIDYLFDQSNSKDKYHFENCSKYNGTTHCWYRNDDGGSLNLKMTKAGPAWKVESMEFVDVS